MTGLVIVGWIMALCLIGALVAVVSDQHALAVIALLIGVLGVFIAGYGHTHFVVQQNTVAITRGRFSQELSRPLQAGIQSRPLMSHIHIFPASTQTPYNADFTPALKGGIGVTMKVQMYIDTGAVDWASEIERVGSFDAGTIMGTWRNSVVRDVADVVRHLNPTDLAQDSLGVQNDIFDAVQPWFEARGITLLSVSLTNWDFTSAEVAAAYDESVGAQALIASEASLLQAAEIQRERLEYEAETANIVARAEFSSTQQLGLTSEDAILTYLMIRSMRENGDMPDNVVWSIGGAADDVGVTVPVVPVVSTPAPTSQEVPNGDS